MGTASERKRRYGKRGALRTPRIVLPMAFLPLLVSAPADLDAQEPPIVPRYDCNRCHSDPTFLAGKTDSPARDSALHVPAELITGSRHAELECTACHVEQAATGYPHRATAVAVPCGRCHEAEGRDWVESVHAANVADEGDAASCVTCHTAHAVYGADDRRSLTYALNVAELCGSCHADPGIVGHYFGLPEKAQAREAVVTYFETVHGAALTRAGLVVSAACNDCHEGHRVLPADDPSASTHRDNQPATCGACHQGVLSGWAESAHGIAYREGTPAPNGRPAPVCADCHSSHGMVRATTDDWFIGVVDECGDCHEDLYETYFETYHGKVTRLGYGMTAKCSDCHTPHAMFPPDDERSSVHPDNLVATCGKCHPASTENFALYYSHGDHRDRERYPRLYWTWVVMSTLLGGVFAFFGLHTAMWLGRLGLDGYRARRKKPSDAAASDGPHDGTGEGTS